MAWMMWTLQEQIHERPLMEEIRYSFADRRLTKWIMVKLVLALKVQLKHQLLICQINNKNQKKETELTQMRNKYR